MTAVNELMATRAHSKVRSPLELAPTFQTPKMLPDQLGGHGACTCLHSLRACSRTQHVAPRTCKRKCEQAAPLLQPRTAHAQSCI